MGLGRKGERVAKTPMRALPPSRGGRTVGGTLLPDCPVKHPDQPDVGKLFQSPQGIRIPVSRFKYNVGLQFLHQTALAGNAELFGKFTVDMGNGLHGIFLKLRHKMAS